MRRALGTGGSVEDALIVVAGDQVQRAAAWLRARGASRIVIANAEQEVPGSTLQRPQQH